MLKLNWVFLACILVSFVAKSQEPTTPTLTIKNVICPNFCQGQNTYKIVFQPLANGVLLPSRGQVVADTIVGIVPQDYKVSLKIIGATNDTITQIVELPVCGPVLPTAPLVASKVGCESAPLPVLNAIVLTPNVAIDWFDKPVGGQRLATNTPAFQPQKAGVYYAETRFVDSGCVSLARTASVVGIQRVLCPTVNTRIVKF